MEGFDAVAEVSSHMVGYEEEMFELVAGEVGDIEEVAILKVQAKPISAGRAIR